MTIYRASTNDQTFTFPFDVSLMTAIQLTYTQRGEIVMEKTKDDLAFSEDGCTMSFQMTQEEANLFQCGAAMLQVRILSEDGECIPTDPEYIKVHNVNHDNILEANG